MQQQLQPWGFMQQHQQPYPLQQHHQELRRPQHHWQSCQLQQQHLQLAQPPQVQQHQQPALFQQQQQQQQYHQQEAMVDFILEHYSEHGENYEEAIAEFMETRMAMRTPTRDFAGIGLLMRYYNQLYFIERRHCAAALLDHPISEFRAETRAALERIQANDSKTQVGQAAALEPVQKIPRWRQRQRRRSGKQSR
ncbi:hypothetical protein TKK_0003132 [Trichogramma kaykai]